MSTLEKRLELFRQLPLRAQLAMINATKSSPVLSQNTQYLSALEAIHAESLAIAPPEAKKTYEAMKSLQD